MAIQVGEKIPNVALQRMTAGGIESVETSQLFAGKRAVLFAVPGAFTPTCSDQHLPGFVSRAGELRAKGVELIACVAVNDAFVMDAWAKAQGVGEEVEMLADGNGELAAALGLTLDAHGFGMGVRSQRYAALIEDGVVRQLNVEPGGGVTVSSAEAMLQAL